MVASGDPPEQVAGLIAFLRDVARARPDPARDVAAHDEVHWLADLPRTIEVRTGATRGDVLFSVPATPLEPPRDGGDFDDWLNVRRWHRALRGLAEKQGVECEPVLATGLLDRTFGDVPVHNHLLVTPVRVVIDPATGRADVVLLDRPAWLQDRLLLESLAGFDADRTGWVREQVRTGQGYALQSSVIEVLRNWCGAAFEDRMEPSAQWTPESRASDAPPSLRLAPALVLRVPGSAAVLDFYDAVLERLSAASTGGGMSGSESNGGTSGTGTSGTGTARPAIARGMAHLVGPSLEGQVAYIRERTPQAIAEVVTALLLRGRRVLIAIPGPHYRTLAALRAALPGELAPLCAGPNHVEEGAAELARRYSAYDPEAHERTISDLIGRLSMTQGIVDDLRQRIGAAYAIERYDIAPGYRGTFTEISERMAEEEPLCSWMPLDDELPPEPPITAEEAARLLRLLAEQTPRRIARTRQALPAPEALPSAERIRALVATEQAGPRDRDRAIRLSEADPRLVAGLRECAATVAEALRALGLPPDADRWDQGDWAVRAMRDGLAGRHGERWDRLAERPGAIEEVERLAAPARGGRVVLPPGDQAALLAAAEQARERLSAEAGPSERGTLRRGRRGTGLPRGVQRLLASVTVDGSEPTTVEALDVLLAELRARELCRAVARDWLAAGVATTEAPAAAPSDEPSRNPSGESPRDPSGEAFRRPSGDRAVVPPAEPSGAPAWEPPAESPGPPAADTPSASPVHLPLEEAVRRLSAARDRLQQVRAAVPAIHSARELLAQAGMPMPEPGAPDWWLPVAVLTGLRARLAAERAAAELDALKTEIETEIEAEIQRAGRGACGRDDGGEAPELHEAVAAVISRDPVTYGRCLVALAEAHREQAEQTQCELLFDRLRAAHPALAALMTARSGDEVWNRRIAMWERAWHWAYASVFVARRPRSEMEQRLEDSLVEALDSRARHATTLTVELAWGWCMSRMAHHPAHEVLPVRVIPIWQIVESIPPEPDAFDVVMLDDTAQEGVEALFLLWLAGQVIMMGAGDPQPVRPVDVEPLEGPLGEVVTPEATVFSVLAARMGPVLESDGPDRSGPPLPAEVPATTAPPPPVDLPLRPGQPVAAYYRGELVELVSRLIAAGGGALSDEELLHHGRTLLGSPPDETVFATARLRCALDLVRASAPAGTDRSAPVGTDQSAPVSP